jgi:hypothetical protein
MALRRILSGPRSLFLFFLIIFLSCLPSSEKKETWAVIINFFSPDTSYYPAIKKFPFPDSLQFSTLENFFTNQDKAPHVSDSAIVFYNNYDSIGQKFCCKADTLEVFIDSINGKKYLFAVGEYIAVFVSDTTTSNLRTRKPFPTIHLGGIHLNTPYPPERFKIEYEKLGAEFVKLDERFDEVYRQKWNDNDSILVETIQFNMEQQEVDSILHFLKKFPALKYNEVVQPGNDTMLFKAIKANLHGISVSIIQTSPAQYSFTMTDYYETIKLIIKNAGTSYIFRDDVKIY